MDIILLQDVEKVGYKYEVVNVKDGYGRNYLIPQKLAIIANKSNLERLKQFHMREEHSADKRRGEIEEIAEKLRGEILKIGAKVGGTGQIFGSVTHLQIANALKEQLDIEVDRRKIKLIEEVTTPGTYTADLELHKEVDTKVTYEVVAE